MTITDKTVYTNNLYAAVERITRGHIALIVDGISNSLAVVFVFRMARVFIKNSALVLILIKVVTFWITSISFLPTIYICSKRTNVS